MIDTMRLTYDDNHFQRFPQSGDCLDFLARFQQFINVDSKSETSIFSSYPQESLMHRCLSIGTDIEQYKESRIDHEENNWEQSSDTDSTECISEFAKIISQLIRHDIHKDDCYEEYKYCWDCNIGIGKLWSLTSFVNKTVFKTYKSITDPKWYKRK